MRLEKGLINIICLINLTSPNGSARFQTHVLNEWAVSQDSRWWGVSVPRKSDLNRSHVGNPGHMAETPFSLVLPFPFSLFWGRSSEVASPEAWVLLDMIKTFVVGRVWLAY